jgi:hypothetical protein
MWEEIRTCLVRAGQVEEIAGLQHGQEVVEQDFDRQVGQEESVWHQSGDGCLSLSRS